MNVIRLSVEPRTEMGKKATKALRNAGKIPAILYSKNGVHHFTTTLNSVKSLIFTPDFKLSEIDLEGETRRAIIKFVDFHPVTDNIQHIDFQELVDGHMIKTEIPLRTKGESPGEKDGGRLMKLMQKIKVKTTPEDLVDELLVDISELLLGSSIKAKDIDVPEGIELLIDSNVPVISVEIPRVIEEEIEEVEEEESPEEKESSGEKESPGESSEGKEGKG